MNIVKKLVVKNLKLNKKRTIVSVIGIILAVALLTALFTLASSFRTSIIKREESKYGDYHEVFFDVPVSEAEKLRENRLVEKVYVQNNIGYALLETSKNEGKPYAYIKTVGSDMMEAFPFELYEGRMPKNSSELLISRHVNTNGRANLNIGDTITLNIGRREATDENGDTVILGQFNAYRELGDEYLTDTEMRTYTIVGMMGRPSYSTEPNSAPGYTFYTVADEENTKEIVDSLYVKLTDKGLLEFNEFNATFLGITDAHERELFAMFSDPDASNRKGTDADWDEYWLKIVPKEKYNWEVNSWFVRYQRMWPIDSMFLKIYILAGFIALIIVATSVYCIKNSFEISVSEKIHLYGMLSEIGATKRQIKKSVLYEAGAEGVIGLPLGIGSGVLAAFVLCKVANALLGDTLNVGGGILMVFDFSWLAVIFSVVCGAVTIYFSSVSAMRKAGKVTPIEAVRNNNEVKIDKKAIKTPKIVSKIWGIGGNIAYKNIARNRKKYRTSVVSIAVCTITFIATSYFVNLLFAVTKNVYVSEESNIVLDMGPEAKLKADETKEIFGELNGIEKVAYVCGYFSYIDGVKYTTKMKELGKADDDEMERMDNSDKFLDFIVMDDESFVQYEKTCGKHVDEGQCIFVDYISFQGAGIARAFDYDDNRVSVVRFDYSEAMGDENGNLIPETIKQYDFSIEVGAETETRPLGYGYQVGCAEVVMSASTFDKLNLKEKWGTDRFVTDIFIVTDRADAIQNEAEQIYANNLEVFGDECSVFNRDQNTNAEKSMYTLIAIGAYGLIIVIALIGITNIINTLGTGMELRARDFATLRSTGMTRKQFDRMIWLESVFTATKALVIGTVIGLGITLWLWNFENRFDMKTIYHPPIIPTLICIAVVLILVYCINKTSLNKINKRNIIESIKNENI